MKFQRYVSGYIREDQVRNINNRQLPESGEITEPSFQICLVRLRWCMRPVSLHYLPKSNAIRDFGRQRKGWECSLSDGTRQSEAYLEGKEE
jgi:hypothetical protein